MTFVNQMPIPEARCLRCGNPSADHVPLRYAIRAWFWHRFHRAVERLTTPLHRIPDTSPDW